MCNILDIPAYLVIMYIEKVFDSLNCDFVLSVLKNLVLVKISYTGQKYYSQ